MFATPNSWRANSASASELLESQSNIQVATANAALQAFPTQKAKGQFGNTEQRGSYANAFSWGLFPYLVGQHSSEAALFS